MQNNFQKKDCLIHVINHNQSPCDTLQTKDSSNELTGSRRNIWISFD